MFVVTENWLLQHLNIYTVIQYGVEKECMAITKSQCSCIGEPYPMKAGWFQRAIGKEITDEHRIRFEERRLSKNTIKRRSKDTPRNRKREKVLAERKAKNANKQLDNEFNQRFSS